MLIVADDQRAVESDLVAGGLRCPVCAVGVLGGWGFARRRVVRVGRERRLIWPRRARCRLGSCRVTHVLLPDVCLGRHKDLAAAIGAALVAREGYRKLGEGLGIPPETVRGWRDRFRARAPVIGAHFLRWARAFDSSLPPPEPRGSPVGDALEAIGVCARVASLSLGTRPAWSWASALTAGGLLCKTRTPWPVPE